MRRFRRTSLSALVLLTATTTLVAGTPHFACRCPNGNIKPFCLGFNTTSADPEAANCCCHGRCCSPRGEQVQCCQGGSNRRSVASCCGSHAVRPARFDPKTRSQVSGACCVRTLVQPQSVSYHRTTVPADETGGQLIALDALQARLPMSIAFHSPAWGEHQRPPPTDLVVTLLHLLI
jgi:hypothetical protein